MPSSVGHALGGVIAGWMVSGAPPVSLRRRLRKDDAAAAVAGPGHSGGVRRWLPTLAFALLGAAPDLDLLFGTHSTYTHSVGAVLIVGVLAWCLARASVGWRDRALLLALGAAAAYGSHVFFDWMGSDRSAPVGIMALWPLTDTFYQSDAFFFMPVSRRYWQPGFLAYTLRVVVFELMVLLPVALLVLRLRREAQG